MLLLEGIYSGCSLALRNVSIPEAEHAFFLFFFTINGITSVTVPKLDEFQLSRLSEVLILI